MAAKAGERAQENGTFKCQSCNRPGCACRRATASPECPNGHMTFDGAVDEPSDRS